MRKEGMPWQIYMQLSKIAFDYLQTAKAADSNYKIHQIEVL
jgi:hypothetical protein